MKKIGLILMPAFTLLLLNLFLCGQNNNLKKYGLIELFKIGVAEPGTREEEPYQFYMIGSISCDKGGNIYVLDYKQQGVKRFDKNGKFIKQIFRKGKGPNEISNAATIEINPFTGHIFILQDYGYTIKEFDSFGNDIKIHLVPQQFFGSFFFLNKDECIYKNAVPKGESYNKFKIMSIPGRKILKEFAPTKVKKNLNHSQRYTVIGNSILWTVPGNEMKLSAFDLNTGKKTKEIRIPGNHRKNTLVKTIIDNDRHLITPIYYNFAQPFAMGDQLFILLILQEYPEKNGKIERFPLKGQRIIYHVNTDDSSFREVGTFNDWENMFIGAVHKNRLLLYSNEPYGRVKVIEIYEIK